MSENTVQILVVDDNPATLYSTCRVLQTTGWKVLEAKCGAEAVELVKQGVDLVVLDVNLPDFDGFEVCRRIRSMPETARIPVVHLSATFVKDVYKVKGLEAGADGYLTHPVEPPVLIATVNAFLRTRQAENELRRSEAKFKAVFDNAIHGIALVDCDLQFLEANPAICRLLSTTTDAIIGRHLHDYIPADQKTRLRSAVAELESRGAWQGVLPMIRTDGESAHFEWHISAYSKPKVWLAAISDVTDRVKFEVQRDQLLASERAARADAERANKLKDDFLATLSHELRTPLNAIIGWSQLLQMAPLDSAEATEGLQSIERNAKIQAQMIADLLDVSRITSGKLLLDAQLLDPAATIESALTAIRPTAAEKSIRIVKKLEPQVGLVSGDPSRLQQVIWNIVSNAVKFTPKSGSIEVSLQRVASHIKISIADTGPGISSDVLPHIFNRFEQGDSSTTRRHGGLGLGLAIAKQLVELHSGTIEVESEGEGRGARFIITLPVSAPNRGAHQENSQAMSDYSSSEFRGKTAALQGLKVLIVEDDADARAMMRRIVLDTGAEALAVKGVNQALAAIDEFKPDILVSDLGMPDQDGYDLIRQVRDRGLSHQDLPAIALTAFARSEDRRRALLAGFQVHVAKPVDPHEIVAAIAALAGRTGVKS